MNSVKALKKAASQIGVSPEAVSAADLINMLDTYGLVLYTDKYGFIRIINGYSAQLQRFYYVEAPLGYATSRLQSYIHINRLGFQTTTNKPFDDFEYFGQTIEPITGFWRLFLTKIMRVPTYDRT